MLGDAALAMCPCDDTPANEVLPLACIASRGRQGMLSGSAEL